MKTKFHDQHPARFAAVTAAVVIAAGISAPGCGGDSDTTDTDPPPDNPPADPQETTQFLERLTIQSTNRVDLVLAIDNSRSMAEKQEILALAVPDLIQGLVNPPCVDQNGVPAAINPAGPLEPCPIAGTKRKFEPVTDLHVGIISSSIGGHAADACPDQENNTCAPNPNFTNNDKGRLIARIDACGGGDVPTYLNKGFLAWDPMQKLSPPGEGNVDNLIASLKGMVTGTGQIGCGYESQLESWYRFLVDPEPYEKISAVSGKATPEGLDQTLLAQRADFLRPDSVLAIIMLTDENDCSIREYGQFFFAAQLKNSNGTPFHLPRARAECAVNPNDPCCLSCGQNPGNCPVDPTCFDANGNVKALTDAEDTPSLRCFDQKRRFGIDFLYPIDRYSTALTSVIVPNRAGELVPNPIFTDLNPTDSISAVRGAGQVFLAGIVGVPWQDIARNKDDLTLGFKNAAELEVLDANGLSTWDIILGNPATLTPPADPHMIESIFPRTGVNPVTGDAIKPPGNPTNPINGSEWTIKNQDDLQYACIFNLPSPRDCTDASLVSCDCKDPMNDSPLCQPDPVNPANRTFQTKAKAYPGIRELSVLQALGPQGITASVCPKQLSDNSQADFGYRPAVGSVMNQVEIALTKSCLQRKLIPNAKGEVSCVVLEARRVDEGLAAACNQCAEPGRQPVSAAHKSIVTGAKQDPIAELSGWNCFCEIPQATNTDANGNPTDNLNACQHKIENPPLNANGEVVNGWCYVDAATPSTGNPEIVAQCADSEKRTLRFVGEGSAKPGATLFLACAQP